MTSNEELHRRVTHLEAVVEHDAVAHRATQAMHAAETRSGFDRAHRELESYAQGMNEQFAAADRHVDAVEAKVDAVDAKVEALEQRVDAGFAKVHSDMVGMRADIAEIKGAVAVLLARIAPAPPDETGE